MTLHLAAVALLVRDFDAAIAYYRGNLGFVVVEDRAGLGGKRWVVIAPSAQSQTRIRLALATTPEQLERLGNQTGGRVLLFLHTDDIQRDYAAWTAKGVNFLEQPRQEEFGWGAIFADLYGNKWELVQLKLKGGAI
jgi:catechol 2,3-dioxygenase-like lactoylglutathione lyase family enzyme